MTDLVAQAKDAMTLGALVWTTVQILKGLLRWWAAPADLPNALVQTIASVVSMIVAACVIPYTGLRWDDWLLQVGIYSQVIILPIALAGHTVAGLGDPPAKLPSPAPPKEVPHALPPADPSA